MVIIHNINSLKIMMEDGDFFPVKIAVGKRLYYLTSIYKYGSGDEINCYYECKESVHTLDTEENLLCYAADIFAIIRLCNTKEQIVLNVYVDSSKSGVERYELASSDFNAYAMV